MSICKVSVVAALLGFAVMASQAHAAFVVTVAQVGSNVVLTGIGTLDTAALTNTTVTGGADFSVLSPSQGIVIVGGDEQIDTFTGFSGPQSFGPGNRTDIFGGGPDGVTGTATGDSVGLYGTDDLLAPPLGYTSGALLSGTTTYDNTTISGLGITPGTYTWTWGSGATADSFTLTTAVPEPFSMGALTVPAALTLLRRRRSIVSNAI